jgi:hypothetical protein
MTRLNMTRIPRLRIWGTVALLAASSLRCQGDNAEPPSATDIEPLSGDGQSGALGQKLADPLVVLVTDKSGNPVQGVTVAWAAQDGGSVSAETVPTGTDGRASVDRVLGSQIGEATTTASVNGLQGSPVTFVSTAVDPSSPSLTMKRQPSSTAESGIVLAVQPLVQVKDPQGNDLAQSGLDVTASLVESTGSLGGTVTRSTDATGLATFTDLAISGPAGSYILRFTAPGTNQVLSTPVTFSATGASLVITTNPPTSAVDGEVFDPAAQPVVEVTDAGGTPAPGVQVTSSLTSGGGTLEGNTVATTDASGTARFADLGIRGAGTHTLAFAAPGAAGVTSSPVNVSALPVEATMGKWGSVIPWDIVPLHMSLMPNGKIVAWGKTEISDTMGMPRIWDPAAGPPTTAALIQVDTMLFCAGHVLMPDGRLMVSGGHLKDGFGIAVTNFFDENGVWQKGPNMAHGRWYPTVTVLPDGRLLTMAGRDQTNSVVTTPEIWENNTWVELPGAGTLEIPYYPRNFVDPKNGLVFYAGERIKSRWFNVDGSGAGGARGVWTAGPNHIWQFNRDYGTAVMYEPGKILFAGGGGFTNWGTPDPKANAPTATAEKIDLNLATPTWQPAGSMSAPRRHLNSTILPDGQVLITGGTRGGGFVDINEADAVKEAELWNPTTGAWTTLAANSIMRVYHSVSMLLPDGTVLHGASGDALAVQPGGAVVPVPPERNHEIFQPPYMFKGARPSISSAPSTVSYGEVFSVATPNAAQITTVRWIRLGSVTHAFDAGQRAIPLSFTVNGGSLEVTAPSGAKAAYVAPPGYYMIFILNRNGVPSTGKVIKVQ